MWAMSAAADRRGHRIVRGIARGRAGYFAAFIAEDVLHALP